MRGWADGADGAGDIPSPYLRADESSQPRHSAFNQAFFHTPELDELDELDVPEVRSGCTLFHVDARS